MALSSPPLTSTASGSGGAGGGHGAAVGITVEIGDWRLAIGDCKGGATAPNRQSPITNLKSRYGCWGLAVTPGWTPETLLISVLTETISVLVSTSLLTTKISPEEVNPSVESNSVWTFMSPARVATLLFHHRGGVPSSPLASSLSFHFLEISLAVSESRHHSATSSRIALDPALALNPHA